MTASWVNKEGRSIVVRKPVYKLQGRQDLRQSAMLGQTRLFSGEAEAKPRHC